VFNHPSAANPNSSNGSGNPSLNAASQTGTAISPGSAGTIIDVQKIPGELSGARALQLAAKIHLLAANSFYLGAAGRKFRRPPLFQFFRVSIAASSLALPVPCSQSFMRSLKLNPILSSSRARIAIAIAIVCSTLLTITTLSHADTPKTAAE